MKEVLVSLEVARLAAKKGFDEECLYYYYESDITKCNVYLRNTDLAIGDISAPTQSFLQKWLREAASTEIFVLPFCDDGYSVDVYIGDYEDTPDNISYNTYEEALENGLKIALESLK